MLIKIKYPAVVVAAVVGADLLGQVTGGAMALRGACWMISLQERRRVSEVLVALCREMPSEIQFAAKVRPT